MKTALVKVIFLFMCLAHTTGLCFTSHRPDFLTTKNCKLKTDSYSANYGPHGEDWGSTGYNPTPFAWLGGYGVQTLETDTPLRLYLTRHRVYSATLNRFLSADPMGLAGGGNLYAYGEGNPMAYIDPLGLCASGGGIDWGYVWEMTTAIASGFVEGLGYGVLSTLDGIIPFANPFESYYAYSDGSIDSDYMISRQIAGISRDILVSAAIPNIGTWAKNPLMYELGSTTVSAETWNVIKGMDTVSRGRYLLAEAGGGVPGYLKALVQGVQNIGQFGTTIGTGLTPSGYLLSIGAIESIDSYRFNWRTE